MTSLTGPVAIIGRDAASRSGGLMRSKWPELSLAASAFAAVLASIFWWQAVVWVLWPVALFSVGTQLLARRTPAALAAGAALLFVVLAAIRDLPDAVHREASRYRVDSRFSSFEQAESFEQSDWGVNADFIVYVRRHLPSGDTFYVATGPTVATTAPQSWLQFELVPNIEQWDSPCSARWVVFYAKPETELAVELDRVHTFLPGYGLGRRRIGGPCAS
jgi:hypothetical protein